jgi:phosphoribosylanthranilate isomerase
VAREQDLERLAELAEGAAVVLVEPWVAGAHGGTSAALPLELAALARERLGGARMALAGGLRPETVERAIALVRPDIVDVSSGVESAPGFKDADLLARFLEVTRDARPRG